MTDRTVLGPTTARNWGWAIVGATITVICGAVAVDGTARAGVGWGETVIPLALAGIAAVAALWVWRRPPFERTALHLTESGVAIEGRRRRVALAWAEIAAVTYRPSSMGPAHMTLERAAASETGEPVEADPITPAAYVTGAAEGGADDAPGVMFPVRATGASAEEVVAFLKRGAAQAGFDLIEPMRGDGRAVHRFPGPRRWVLTLAAPPREPSDRSDSG